QNCSAFVSDCRHLPEALLLEYFISDRQHLVDNQDLRLQIRCNCESQTNIHAAAVTFDRRIDEPVDVGKSHDLVKLARQFFTFHPHDYTVEKYIFSTCQFRMKPGADFKETADTPVQLYSPAGWLRDAGEN